MSAPHAKSAEEPTSSNTARIRVRRALPSDIDDVVALRLALLREHPNHPVYGRLHPDVDARARQLFASQLRASGEIIFLAEYDGRVAGIIRCVEMVGSPLLEPAHYAYVSSAYVQPDFRQRGLLRALVRMAERWADERGLDELRLHNVAGSASAESAWSALGYQVVEQVRRHSLKAR